jgi:hypothetical protein
MYARVVEYTYGVKSCDCVLWMMRTYNEITNPFIVNKMVSGGIYIICRTCMTVMLPTICPVRVQIRTRTMCTLAVAAVIRVYNSYSRTNKPNMSEAFSKSNVCHMCIGHAVRSV